MTNNNVMYDEEDLELIRAMKEILAGCTEFVFSYKGKTYRIEPVDGKLVAYLEEENSPESMFSDLDDLMQHYIVEGLPFKDIVPEIDDYGQYIL